MDAEGKFTDRLDKHISLMYLNNGFYRVLEQVVFEWKGKTYTVPEGYESDGFTIPKWMRWAFPKVPKKGLKAAVLHDWYCEHGKSVGVSRQEADQIFKEALNYLNVKTRRVCVYTKGVQTYTRLLKLRGLA